MWFAFKLVSLNHWKQPIHYAFYTPSVVICFQISIFEPLETTFPHQYTHKVQLWFAFKLVSLNHWKQRFLWCQIIKSVVICFQISIFEPLETTKNRQQCCCYWLWFAFKLVSLNHWKQQEQFVWNDVMGCDLLSN